ncbi:MAG: hypothetical protein KBF26_13845, partial [Opitutaceae bacterium]|nr:hypothetical protein [Opitutaceae bacterium]
LIAVTNQLAVLESPSVDLVLTPSETRGATIAVNFLADKLDLRPALPVEANRVSARTWLPLLGDRPTVMRIEASATAVHLPQEIMATDVRLLLRGRVNPAERSFDFRRFEAVFGSLSGQGLTATDGAVRATPGPLPQLNAEVVTLLMGEPLALQGDVNPLLRSARVRLAGRFAPGLLAPLGRRLGHDLRPYVNFGTPIAFDLRTGFDPGWKFTGVTGRVSARAVTAYKVLLDTLDGQIEFDGRHFIATDAMARLGPNFARGSFEQDFTTREFRFLLQGRLDPPAIGGWFHEWWPNFWQNFDFANAAPDANVDVHGFWGQGAHTTVFVFADCVQPVVRGVALDHAITRIFIRPHYYDAMEVFMTRGSGAARGWFTRALDPENYALRRMEFDFNSTLELPGSAGLVGPEIVEVVQPFVFSNAPTLTVRGQIDGPAAATGEHRQVHVAGHTTGPFSFYKFPLNGLSFNADLQDDVLVVEPLEVGFANGVTTGKIRLAGPEAKRQLGFDLGVKQANFRDAAAIMEKFIAERHGQPPPASSNYVERNASVSLALGLSAEGMLDDPFSFTGTGNAELTGQGLGKIRLLGLLSELLNFTALRFDSLRTNFTVERDKLVFPELSLTGNNAAIEAHGSYLLNRKELDFYARVYPFQESRFILKSVMGAVLTPLSNILEVKLGGSLEKPSWAFVIGPTNFLRSLFSSPSTDKSVLEPSTTPTAPTPSGKLP